MGAAKADDVAVRLFAVLVTAMVVPGVAFFQTAALMRKMNSQPIPLTGRQRLCRRMTVSHAAVWFSASLAIVWALRWQDVVRGNWQLDRWPLIDELVILFPVLLPMAVSWAIFYQLQRMLSVSAAGPVEEVARVGWCKKTWTDWRTEWAERLGYVSLRFRLYFLLILVPVSLFVAIKDWAELTVGLSPTVIWGMYAVGMFGLLLFFSAIADDGLEDRKDC